MAPDVNVLLAASRDDHAHHRQAKAWLDKAIQDCLTGASIELLPMVVAGFLRVATHPKAFEHPMPIANALAFVDALAVVPGVEMVEIGREWPTLKRLCADRNLAGNDIPDAWIAAAVRMLGVHLVTFDRGFTYLLDRAQLTVLGASAQAGTRA